ncbi:hypothetical protein LO763_22370 [Glycomyces sp. A-F 0318]|uniref:hypothetical protein n=1 Tax=Glycomyces amatae TaxID=2881355 RepID=UPI001E3DC8ED|nr:hypothetical protein [Glycomyces amatae]MCD0446364.1 hypothetical protein [Glycomyces amatae]
MDAAAFSCGPSNDTAMPGLPVVLHPARHRAAGQSLPLPATRRRVGLTPLLPPLPHDPAAVIAAVTQCPPRFAAAWPDRTPDDDRTCRTWTRRPSVDKTWNNRIADLTDDETAGHDVRHEHAVRVRRKRSARDRVSINVATMQRRRQCRT